MIASTASPSRSSSQVISLAALSRKILEQNSWIRVVSASHGACHAPAKCARNELEATLCGKDVAASTQVSQFDAACPFSRKALGVTVTGAAREGTARRGAPSLIVRLAEHPQTTLRLLSGLRATAVLVFGLLWPWATARSQPAATRVVRGIVTDSAGRPRADARVVVRSGPDLTADSTRTSLDGSWQLSVPSSATELSVRVSSPGFRAAGIRRTRQSSDSGFADVVVRLSAIQVAQDLPTVRVAAEPDPLVPETARETRGRAGDSDDFASGVQGTLGPMREGVIAQMAQLVPGVQPTAAGPSVLGLPASQSAVRVEGLASVGQSSPRCLDTRLRVTSATADVSRGGFSAAQLDLTIASGGDFAFRSVDVAGDLTAGVVESSGSPVLAPPRSGSACLAASGPIPGRSWYYSAAAQIGHDAGSALSLPRDASRVAGALGFASDSLNVLATYRSQAGLPSLPEGGERTSTSASAVLRLDRRAQEGRAVDWLVVVADGVRATGLSDASVGTGASALTRLRSGLSLIASSTRASSPDALNELRAGLSIATEDARPGSAIPAVIVPLLAPTTAPLGTVAQANLGGSEAPRVGRLSSRFQVVDELQWRAGEDRTHRLKASGSVRVDLLAEESQPNPFGLLSYASLDDLRADRPSRFARTLAGPRASAGQALMALSIGDEWRLAETFRLAMGVRVDANAWLRAPLPVRIADSLFGVQSSTLPHGAWLSPRLAFEWRYGGDAPNALASTAMAASTVGVRGTLRGGIGAYRADMNPALALPIAAGGAVGGTRRLACFGSAVPARRWAAWLGSVDSLPSLCAPGAPAQTDNAPSIVVASPDFSPEVSWRGHLEWQQPVSGVVATVRATLSVNRNQPSRVDLNFAGVPRGSLPTEGNRPLWSPPTDIDSSTGVSNAIASRRFAQLGPSWELRSDLRSESRQLLVSLSPAEITQFFWRADYVLAEVRQQFRSFDGPAGLDPRSLEWARGDLDVRHAVQLQAGLQIGRVSITTRGWGRSGVPFTPVVSGDVLARGSDGDRAYVFTPSRAPDAQTGAAMASLLQRAPSWAQACLATQADRVAVRNACEGPWTFGLDVGATYAGSLPLLGRRAQASLTLVNALAAVDQLVNGGRQSRGWGDIGDPDPVLLRVGRYDPAAQRFSYVVNDGFGRLVPLSRAGLGTFALTLNVRVALEPPLSRQRVMAWLLPGRPGRPGRRLSVDELTSRYLRTLPSPYASILRSDDLLLLSNTQASRLRELERAWTDSAAAAWGEHAKRMSALLDGFDECAAIRDEQAVRSRLAAHAWSEVRRVLPMLLTSTQLAVLPDPAKSLLQRPDAPADTRGCAY